MRYVLSAAFGRDRHDRGSACRRAETRASRSGVSLRAASSFDERRPARLPRRERAGSDPCPVPSKRITPSGLQVPSAPVGASQIFCGGPPATSTFFSLPSAMKREVPAVGRPEGATASHRFPAAAGPASAFSGRIQIRFLPVESVASKARMRPSGEMRGASIVVTSAGGTISKRTMRGGFGVRSQKPNAERRGGERRRRPRRPRRASRGSCAARRPGAGSPACEPPSAIHSSCSFTSCAVWKRSSGSFARHVLTTRSSAGGIIGAASAIDGGSSRRIEPISDAWLLPENAFLPVAIS